MFSKFALSAIALAALSSAQSASSTDSNITPTPATDSSSATSYSDTSYSTPYPSDVSTSTTSSITSSFTSSVTSSSASGTTSTTATSSSGTSTASTAVHSVSVGQGGLKYTPDSFTAAVGDQVEFHFVAGTHSVTQGDFANPCQPLNASAFNSGVLKGSGQVFTITVNSTDPIYFYCAVEGHCQAGMVGVINGPAGKGVTEYAAAAAGTSDSSAPSQVQGGHNGTATAAPSGTTSGATSTSGSATGSVSPAASHTNAASGDFQVGFLSVALAVTVMLFGHHA